MQLSTYLILQVALGIPNISRGEVLFEDLMGSIKHPKRELPLESTSVSRELGLVQASLLDSLSF
jgi:hypothetical protein